MSTICRWRSICARSILYRYYDLRRPRLRFTCQEAISAADFETIVLEVEAGTEGFDMVHGRASGVCPIWSDPVAEVPDRTGPRASRPELETTETVLIRDAVAAMDVLQRLKSPGARIVIDDLGTGYPSSF